MASMKSFTVILAIIAVFLTGQVMLSFSLLILQHYCGVLAFLRILTMPKRSFSSTSSPTDRSSTTLCDGCQKPFKRVQVHLNHYPACNSLYASRKCIIDRYGGIGDTVIDSAAKAAQYHASLSSLIVTGVNTGRESRSRQRLPAAFEVFAQNVSFRTERKALTLGSF